MQNVEVYVQNNNDTQSLFNFPDQPQLRWAKLWYIETFCISDMTVTPSNHALVTYANMLKSYLILNCQDLDSTPASGNNQNAKIPMGEYINYLPLVTMHRVQQGTNAFTRQLYFFNGMAIDWSKSKVFIPGGPGVSDFSWMFNVWYSSGPMNLHNPR